MKGTTNINKRDFLRRLLCDCNAKLTFELKQGAKTKEFFLEGEKVSKISFDDILRIRKGKEVVFESKDWAKISPYTASFDYEKFQNWTMISNAFGPQHVCAMPVYTIEVYDFKGRRIRKEDVYEIIKYYMTGKRFTPNKRMQFERAFLRVLDDCKRFDFYSLIREAISQSGI